MSPEGQEKLDILIRHIHTLPSLPSVIVEIMQSFNNDKIDTSTLAKQIESDLGIVAKVLRVANSPFFGLSGQIGSIFEAIVVIGFNNLRGLVTSAAIINVLPKQLRAFDLQEFWQHSIRTAVCARVLAKPAGIDPEAAFTAGLLHDIGILVIGMYFPEAIEKADIKFDIGTAESLQREHDVIGMDHAALGGEVVRHWHFPEAIQQAITQHHMEPEHKNILVDVMYVANLFSHSLSHESTADDSQLQLSANERLGIDNAELESLAKEANQLYSGALMLIGA
ncbi:MAG TPA: HDOD domain-containing protein [Methyloradius sp.]